MCRFLKSLFCLGLSLVLGLSNVSKISAQVPECTFVHYGMEQGMASNIATQVMQDSRGFMWFCTWDGILRFDGYRFKNYNILTHTGLVHNRVVSLKEDARGYLWLKTYDDKLVRFDRRTEKFDAVGKLIAGGENMKFGQTLLASNGDVWAEILSVGFVRIAADGGDKISGVTVYKFSPAKRLSLLLEDNNGNVWCGADDGVIRFNKSSGAYEHTQMRSNVRVTSACEYDSRIYFGYENGDVDIFDSKLNRYSGKLNAGASVNVLKADTKGRIYVGTKKGVAAINPLWGTLTYAANISACIDYIYIDAHGQIWSSSNGIHGVFRTDPSSMQSRHYTQYVEVHRTFLTEHEAKFIECNGRLWISLESGGFGLYDREHDRVDYFHNNPSDNPRMSNVVADFAVTPDNVLWLITHGKGVERVTLKDKKLTRLNVSDNRLAAAMIASGVRGIMCDTAGELWLGTRSGGIVRLDRQQKTKEIIETDGSGTPIGFTYSIMRDRSGDTWLGTLDRGVFCLEQKDGKRICRNYCNNPDDINSLPYNKVHSVIEDRAGRKWFGTFSGGVAMLTPDGRMHSPDGLLAGYPESGFRKVRTLCEDSLGRVWVGTTEGIMIIKYNPDSGSIDTEFHQMQSGDDTSLPSNDIVYIYRDSEQTLWIATFGGGLSRYMGVNRRTGRPVYRTYREPSGKTSHGVFGIAEDDYGNIWFTTETNICVLNKVNGMMMVLNEHEGVDASFVAEEGAIVKSPDGRLFFGTSKGCFVIDPESLKNANVKLSLQLTDFELDERVLVPGADELMPVSLPYAGSVTIPNNHSVFALRFVALNYAVQHRINYQYMLEGYDDHWRNDEGRMRAVYSKVPGGKYKFRVRAFPAENPDAGIECTVDIIVKEPLWLSESAVRIYIALLVLGLGGLLLHWFNKRRIYRRSLESRRVVRISPDTVALKDDGDEAFLSSIMAYLEANFQNPDIKIEDIVNLTASGRSTFYHRFKELTGRSPVEFLYQFRLDKGKMFLLQTELTIAEIAFKTGFSSAAYFTSSFKKQYGGTPSEFRKQNRV